MLKIKDDVDLKELEKFGFNPRYDEYTGKMATYENYRKLSNKEKEEMGLTVVLETTKGKIRIFRAFRQKNIEWRINQYNDRFDVDTLYDLIKADLVEKVGTKNGQN